MHIEIVHQARGRLRLRVPGLRHDKTRLMWIQKTLTGAPGIGHFRINLWCEALILEGRPEDDRLYGTVALLRATAIVSLEAESKEPKVVVSTMTAVLRFTWTQSPLVTATAAAAISFGTSTLATAASAALVAVAAFRSARNAWRVISRERRLNVDFLDTLAIAVSLGRGQMFTAAFMAWMIALGDWIRDRTAAQSKRAMSSLLQFQAAFAWVLQEGKVTRIASGAVNPGDRVIVYPGEMIPVDGRILRGSATVDQKIVTGESMPSEKGPNEEVYASSVVREGKLIVEALRVGDNTTAAQIVRLVDSVPAGETRMQNHAEKLGDRLVAPSLLLTSAIFAATGNVDRLLSMLIIDFGTGIRVAAPTSVLAAMAHAARNGILIKSGRHMEQLATLDTIIFDKTGTLTYGRPHVSDIISLDDRSFPTRKIIGLAAAAEARLTHPVSAAIVSKAVRDGIDIPARSESEFQVGLGVKAQVNGYSIHVGNERFLKQCGVRAEPGMAHVRNINEEGCSALLFAVDGKVKGVIAYADELRPDSAPVIRALRRNGVRHIVMITGDNTTVARAVARRLEIDSIYAETLPADKAEIVRNLQQRGHSVAMVGDGINDSPALAYADVGVSLKHGADVARETADVVLMEDSLWKLVYAVEISKKAMNNVKQNYAIIAGLNGLAMALAIPTGLVSPNISALISNGSAIVASLNAIRPVLGNPVHARATVMVKAAPG